MHQPPYRFATPPPDKARRWPLPRVALWIVLFASMGAWAYLILAT